VTQPDGSHKLVPLTLQVVQLGAHGIQTLLTKDKVYPWLQLAGLHCKATVCKEQLLQLMSHARHPVLI